MPELYEYLRQVERDGKLILQVRRTIFVPSGDTGQGKYDEQWVDVPIVKQEQVTESND